MLAVNEGVVPPGSGHDTRTKDPRDCATRHTVTPVVVMAGIVSSALAASHVVPSLENCTTGAHDGLVPDTVLTPMCTSTEPPTLPTGWTVAVDVFPAAVTTVDDAACVVIFGMMTKLSDAGSPLLGCLRSYHVALLAKYLTAFGSTVTAPVRTSARNATWSLPKAYSFDRSNRMPPAIRTFSADISPK